MLGGTLQVDVDNVSATGLSFMVIGYTTFGPFPISAIGLTNDPTCLGTVSPDVFVGPLGVAGSTATFLLPIPADSALTGAQLHFQGLQLEFTNGFWNLSDRGTATLGF